jgi:hypothetical protein
VILSKGSALCRDNSFRYLYKQYQINAYYSVVVYLCSYVGGIAVSTFAEKELTLRQQHHCVHIVFYQFQPDEIIGFFS